jgi:hypothetical protein
MVGGGGDPHLFRPNNTITTSERVNNHRLWHIGNKYFSRFTLPTM